MWQVSHDNMSKLNVSDYFFIDCISKDSVAIPEESLPDFARHISTPHYGIFISFKTHTTLGVGSDGVIAILPPTVNEKNVCARMRVFNMDGSEGNLLN